jgi:hypothetical protein
MSRLLLLLSAALLLALPLAAQDMEWQFEQIFPPDTLQTNANGFHGVAVDPDGKVWLQTHNARLGEVNGAPAEALHIFNADGTEVDFSPLTIIQYASAPADTIGLRLGRGMATDHQGNILASYGQELFKINYQTGQGMARVSIGTPPAAATADALGNIYLGTVLTGHPIRVFDTNLNHLENVRNETIHIARSHVVAPDGLTFYETNPSIPYTIIHKRADEFSPWDSVGVAFEGMRIETGAFNPATGNLWVSAGNTSDGVNNHPSVETDWRSNTWYEFDPDDLTTPLNSISWVGCDFFDEDGFCVMTGIPPANVARPRGMAFSPDGNTVYLASFNAAPSDPGAQLQQWTFAVVSTDPTSQPGLFTLAQNYPNPFTGSTTIDFEIEEAGYVTLRVFDVLGRQVAVVIDGTLPADSHTARLDAGSLATGTYVYTLELNGQVLGSRRMLVIN